MKNLILTGIDNTKSTDFLKEKFDCIEMNFFNEKEKYYDFSPTALEDIILKKEIDNLFILDPELFRNIFLKSDFYDSPCLSNIKNIFLIPETFKKLSNLSSHLPHSLIGNSSVMKDNKNSLKGGIVKKKGGNRDILYQFYPSFKFEIEEDIMIFKKYVIEENEFFLDIAYKKNFYSLISEIEMDRFLPVMSKVNGKLLLFSNLKIEDNKDFYIELIKKEINR